MGQSVIPLVATVLLLPAVFGPGMSPSAPATVIDLTRALSACRPIGELEPTAGEGAVQARAIAGGGRSIVVAVARG